MMNEKHEAWLLGGLGFAKGVGEAFIESRQSTKALVGLGLSIGAYEALCDDGEMISQRFDEWLENPKTRKITEATTLAIGGMLVGHLLNKYEKYGLEKFDGIHQIGQACRKLRNT